MKKWITILAVSTLMVGASVSANAQGAGPGNGRQKPPAAGPGGQGGPGGKPGEARGQGRGRMMQMSKDILEKLNLTKEQKSKIEALNAKTKAAMEKLRGQAGKGGEKGGNREGMREKMMEIMKNHREEMMKILTPKQKAEFEKLMKEAMEKWRKEHPGGPGGAGGPGGRGGAPRPGGAKPGGAKPPL